MDKQLQKDIQKGKYNPRKVILNRGDKFKNLKEKLKDVAKKIR